MTEPCNVEILNFWGKARPLHPDPYPRWHPLVFHSLDVAAVGDALLARDRGLKEAVLRILGLSREDSVQMILFLLALHDIGKFAKRFQAKAPALYPKCLGGNPADVPERYDHGAGAFRLFRAVPDLLGLSGGSAWRAWWPLLSAIGGHHGAPPAAGINDNLHTVQVEFGRHGIEAARAFIQCAQNLFDVPPKLPPVDSALSRRASFAVAGVAVLADWIGSNQEEWFPYHDPSVDIETYWRTAQERADRAVEQAGVLPAGVNRQLDYGSLIGPNNAPSPMQEWARSVDLPEGPSLFLIEDETGSGKTEAALMLAHRLMAGARAAGLYVALPGMATANAMFDRLAASHRHLFAAGATPSVALAHGARDLHRGFQSAKLRGGRDEAPYGGIGGRSDESDTTASAACAAWVADDRRRAFLADVGAGTIDQALLAVLPVRHQSLRLLGLMRRVLILDEVHAYDAYMQREMERLLAFQAALGGSAILLSATLPLSIRKRLTDAFTSGQGAVVAHADSSMEYPLATACATDRLVSTSVAGQARRARTLPVRFLRSAEDALSEVVRAARAGKAVLYIRNTVDDALDAHTALQTQGLAPALFHARFAMTDRLDIERTVVRCFGKHSRPDDRAGQVLVATQVVEQSLDLDFDVIVTDLAPIDLLIQRAGRLWRHHRPERAGQPELLVVAPEATADADERWFARAFPRAQYVYQGHAHLWLTARALEDAGVIESPAGLRTLIESVYGKDAQARLPRALHGYYHDAEGRAGVARGVATSNLLDAAKGYVRDAGAWDSDVRTPTRLADDARVTLRLARLADSRVEPYAPAASVDERWRAWRLSEVNVSARRFGGEAVPDEIEEAVRVAKTDWTRFDKAKILVVLEEADVSSGVLLGSAASTADGGGEVRLRYHRTRGLEVLKTRPAPPAVPDR